MLIDFSSLIYPVIRLLSHILVLVMNIIIHISIYYIWIFPLLHILSLLPNFFPLLHCKGFTFFSLWLYLYFCLCFCLSLCLSLSVSLSLSLLPYIHSTFLPPFFPPSLSFSSSSSSIYLQFPDLFVLSLWAPRILQCFSRAGDEPGWGWVFCQQPSF